MPQSAPPHQTGTPADGLSRARELLLRTAAEFKQKPFIPHPLFRQGDLQTLAAHFWPGRFKPDYLRDEARFFQVDSETRLLAHCRWQPNPKDSPTLALWHGMEGSTDSVYMRSTADKAFGAGFNVVRVNYRSCGGTEELTPTLYHGGLTGDLRIVIDELIGRDQLPRLFIGGFSLGGNMALKLAGEYGSNPPTELRAVCAISPSIDFRASCDLIMQRRNWIYHREFVGNMKQRLRYKAKLFPQVYDLSNLDRVTSLAQFDDQFTARMFGFAGIDDYYRQASSRALLNKINVPTLIIHAEDDPFIPFTPLRDPAIAANPYLRLVATKRGGHVAFVGRKVSYEDRFWAENRLVEFFKLSTESAD